MELAIPSTLKELRGFISMANFLQCHILQLSSYLAPLNKLVKEKSKQLA